MAKKKQISRKQLLKEPDEFLTVSAKVIAYAKENQKTISYIAIGLAALVLIGLGFRYFSGLSERRAYALFSQGLSQYISQNWKQKTASAEEFASNRFAEVLNKYPSSTAARLSLPLLADMNFKQGSYDRAIELYERAIDAFSEDTMRTMMLNGLAYCYEAKGDFSAAAQAFQKITEAQEDFAKGDAYFNLGRMHEALNDTAKAREAYEKVAQDYSGSVNASIAKEKVLHLEG